MKKIYKSYNEHELPNRTTSYILIGKKFNKTMKFEKLNCYHVLNKFGIYKLKTNIRLC